MPRTARRCAAALALACAAVIGLAACSAPSPEALATSSPTATREPVFSSDEEALAAAIDAYDEYLAMSVSIASSGDDFTELREVTTPDYGETRIRDLKSFSAAGLRVSGAYRADSTSIVSRSLLGEAELVTIYTCQDVSGTRILDAEGNDVTPPDRDLRAPMVVELELTETTGRVSGTELWSGKNFC
ncbi:hypothetical protein [Agromyces sp. SYSU T0242]|uniref:hypothetical protein n=1 Tax=Agromyces litoreus TaxID=3158561 RepID=UPI003393A5FE